MSDSFMDTKENLIPIGEAAKRGNISRRTLRHYENLELIKPDFVDTNGYRYYSMKTILKISIIKYLKFMEFSLDQIKIHINNPDFSDMIESFDDVLKVYDQNIEELQCRREIAVDWKNLLEEACLVLSMGLKNISIKYLDSQSLIMLPMHFDYNYQVSVLDLNFTNFIESENNKISGAVMFYFSSLEDRMRKEEINRPVEALYIQKALKKTREEITFTLPSGMYVSKYHLGSHSYLKDSYEELIRWQKNSGYEFKGPVIERFVSDYWSTADESKYVTELLAPIK